MAGRCGGGGAGRQVQVGTRQWGNAVMCVCRSGAGWGPVGAAMAMGGVGNNRVETGGGWWQKQRNAGSPKQGQGNGLAGTGTMGTRRYNTQGGL